MQRRVLHLSNILIVALLVMLTSAACSPSSPDMISSQAPGSGPNVAQATRTPAPGVGMTPYPGTLPGFAQMSLDVEQMGRNVLLIGEHSQSLSAMDRQQLTGQMADLTGQMSDLLVTVERFEGRLTPQQMQGMRREIDNMRTGMQQMQQAMPQITPSPLMSPVPMATPFAMSETGEMSAVLREMSRQLQQMNRNNEPLDAAQIRDLTRSTSAFMLEMSSMLSTLEDYESQLTPQEKQAMDRDINRMQTIVQSMMATLPSMMPSTPSPMMPSGPMATPMPVP